MSKTRMIMDHYKISLSCNRSDAEQINARIESGNEWTDNDHIPTIVTREVVEFDDNQWMIDIYFSKPPDDNIFNDIRTLLDRKIPKNIAIEKFVDEDWTSLSQAGLEAINIGRFHIHNHDEQAVEGKINLCISAGQAFGTGHHNTTAGCLKVLDNLHQSGRTFNNIADLGTGTGLLAFATHKLWPESQIIASDIDPIAVQFALDAARDNDISLGHKKGHIEIICASGTDHDTIQSTAPYDLLIANILAGPLIELAPAFHELLDTNAYLLLAGLLDSQIERVSDTYTAQSMQLISVNHDENWPVMLLQKKEVYDGKQSHSTSRRTSQKDGDYGEW